MSSETDHRAELSAAMDRVQRLAHVTPVLTSRYINELTGCEVFFKCENFQKTGSFKFRGASNSVAQLTTEQLSRGVVAHSSGNHGQALAYAARLAGTPCVIVMPNNSVPAKVAAARGYGAEVVFCEPNIQSRTETAERIASERGMTLVHPYDYWPTIYGQGTCVMEVLKQVADPDFVFVPVGGGGLTAGSCLAAEAFSTKTRIVACEPAAADDAFRSLQAGVPLGHSAPVNTICDGLRTAVGKLTFSVFRDRVAEVVCVSEQEIMQAMQLILERLKIVAEPSCCVTLAALIQQKARFAGKKVVLVLTGGNVNVEAMLTGLHA